MKVAVMCFSPTGTTRRVCLEIAQGISDSDPTVLDLTLPDGRTVFMGDPERLVADYDHVVVGVPVYGGKIPPLARDVLSLVKGHGRPATAVAVYGNRDFGVALRRLCQMLESNGFQVVSAGAFIGEHSYSAVVPVALNRPDAADLDNARLFGSQSARASGVLAVDDVEEQLDMFSKSPNIAALKPRYLAASCTQCGSCSEVCPIGIIASGSGAYASSELRKRCIGCMACVRTCPSNARRNEANLMERLMLGMVLKKPSRERLEPKVFMPA
ncbi:MAG: 4Fe-4S dicluster domain-containing protein [Spirochaetaceae bacterium]|nr:MAG: 4Fe-4S dicluster domain-containing protein [Spirochaetaceae bacterium]